VVYTANTLENFEGVRGVIVLKQIFANHYSCLMESKEFSY
jgi:hypothetical protein